MAMVTRTRLNVTFIRTTPVLLTLVLNGGELPASQPGHSIPGGKAPSSLLQKLKPMNADENNIHDYTGRFKQNVPYYGRKFLK